MDRKFDGREQHEQIAGNEIYVRAQYLWIIHVELASSYHSDA
jgi:hypothetical protein